jgi:hypothetical protein
MRNGSATQALTAIRALNLGITAMSTRPPSLDDVYLRVTGERFGAAA